MSEDSYIETSKVATTFVGEDATKLFAAATLRSAIDLYVKAGVKVNRAYTPSAMAATASRYTGKTYSRGKRGLAQASHDLNVWIEAMKSALPVKHRS